MAEQPAAVNDHERGLHRVFGKWLDHLAPFNPHLKRQVIGREVMVAITKGKLDFGHWEQIFYGEFDGNRPKRVLIKIIGE